MAGCAVNDTNTRELLLIGAVHCDPDGQARLRRVLTRERPAAVAVEVSPYALLYRRRNGPRLRRNLIRKVASLAQRLEVSWRRWGQIHAIRTQLSEPYEYRGAMKYCRDTGATLSCLDSSEWSKRWIGSQWQQLLSHQNIAALLGEQPQDLREQVHRSYLLARLLLSENGQTLVPAFSAGWWADSLWHKREVELATRLQSLYGTRAGGQVAYVCGWHHLLSSGRGVTLYERLAYLQPRRMLLSEEE